MSNQRLFSCFTSTVALAVGLFWSVGANAQAIDTGAITFDVDDTATGGEEILLIAAYTPREAEPLISADRDIRRVALRADESRPQPSLVLGVIEPGMEEEFGIEGLLTTTVEQFGFEWDDLEAREALRKDNPEMLFKIVDGGHADPPEETLSVALQTELARMSCYRMGIDGAFGRGSQRAVGEYWEQVKEPIVEWSDRAASFELFRAIVINGDVKCPVPVAAPARTTPRATTTRRATTSTTTTTRRPAATTTTTSRPAATTTTKPAAKPKPNVTGVFR